MNYFKKALNIKSFFILSLLLVSSIAFGSIDLINDIKHPTDYSTTWAYDSGLDPRTPEGKEFLDMIAKNPFVRHIVEEFLEVQKHRYAGGTNIFRGILAPNSIQILAKGQEGTHQSEAWTRPGGSGFGAQVQGFGWAFGVTYSMATTNAFFNTIKGQYAGYNTPYIYSDNGKIQLRTANMVSNDFWLYSHHPDSELAKARNWFLDWVIRNNRESLKLIITLGGGAADAMGNFILSKGGEIKARVSDKQVEKMLFPQYKMKYAGGNNEFPVPEHREGGDFYAKMMGESRLDYKKRDVQNQVLEKLGKEINIHVKDLVFTGGGYKGSGIVHPAQIAGFDFGSIKINGKRTRNLKGLPLSDGTTMGDLLILDVPHPAGQSRPEKIKNAHKVYTKKFAPLKKYPEIIRQLGDEGFINDFLEKGGKIPFRKQKIPGAHADFMTAKTLTVGAAQAQRPDKYTISVGSRNRPRISKATNNERLYAKPNSYPEKGQIWVERPGLEENRYSFDRGPGEENAKLMLDNLNARRIFKTKPGMNWKNNGIDAYYTGSHPKLEFYGGYRGQFHNPKAVIFADPAGNDEILTKKALTGARGQHLHHMMETLGFGYEYLVFKTVPFSMEDKTAEDWKHVLKETENYRNVMYKRIIESKPEVIFTDGKWAAQELERIAKELDIPVINIKRKANSASYGIAAAMRKISPEYERYRSKGANIPYQHMPLFSRLWWGTTGDRVWSAPGKEKGLLYVTQVPKWAAEQKLDKTYRPEVEMAVEKLIEAQRKANVLRTGQSVSDFLIEKGSSPAACLNAFVKKN